MQKVYEIGPKKFVLDQEKAEAAFNAKKVIQFLVKSYGNTCLHDEGSLCIEKLFVIPKFCNCQGCRRYKLARQARRGGLGHQV